MWKIVKMELERKSTPHWWIYADPHTWNDKKRKKTLDYDWIWLSCLKMSFSSDCVIFWESCIAHKTNKWNINKRNWDNIWYGPLAKNFFVYLCMWLFQS